MAIYNYDYIMEQMQPVDEAGKVGKFLRKIARSLGILPKMTVDGSEVMPVQKMAKRLAKANGYDSIKFRPDEYYKGEVKLPVRNFMSGKLNDLEYLGQVLENNLPPRYHLFFKADYETGSAYHTGSGSTSSYKIKKDTGTIGLYKEKDDD